MIESRHLPNVVTSVCAFTTLLLISKVVFSVRTSIPSYSSLAGQFLPGRELKLGGIAANMCGCNLDTK
jgi:hypothetical protein